MVDITRRVDDVYGSSRVGGFFTKDAQVERGDTMESIGEFITGLRNDVDSIHTSSTLSVAMLQLQAMLRETHVMGDVLYPHGAMRVVQLDISDRETRAGTLSGDATGIVYTASQGNIDGWSDGLTGAARFHSTTIGHRVAQVARTPSSGQYTRLTQSENDAGTAFAVLGIDSNNDLNMQNPVNANEWKRFTRPDNTGYTPAVGDYILVSFYIDGSRTVEVLLSVRTAAGVWQSYNDLFFTVDPGVTPTPQSSFNLAEYHLQHANVGNTRTIFDQVFLLRHPYIRHQEFSSVFTDFTGTAPDSIGLGNRIVGQGAAVLEVTEGMKFANTTVVRNSADNADLNIATELAKINRAVVPITIATVGTVGDPTMLTESQQLRLTINEAGVTLADLAFIQIHYSHNAVTSHAEWADNGNNASIPIQSILGFGGNIVPSENRGATAAFIRIRSNAANSTHATVINGTDTAIILEYWDANNAGAPIGFANPADYSTQAFGIRL